MSKKGISKRPVIDGKKKCNGCEKMLPLSSYHKSTGPGGRSYKCKRCQQEYYREYRDKLKAQDREYPEEKTCSWCKGTFGPEAFNKNASRPDGLQSFCADCHTTFSQYHYYRPKPQKVKWEDVEAKKDRLNQFQPSLDT